MRNTFVWTIKILVNVLMFYNGGVPLNLGRGRKRDNVLQPRSLTAETKSRGIKRNPIVLVMVA